MLYLRLCADNQVWCFSDHPMMRFNGQTRFSESWYLRVLSRHQRRPVWRKVESWQPFQRQSAAWLATRSEPDRTGREESVVFSLWSFFLSFFFSEREADHAEVAELWSIGGEGVEEMGEFLYFLHLEGDKETRKLQTLWEMRINV